MEELKEVDIRCIDFPVDQLNPLQAVGLTSSQLQKECPSPDRKKIPWVYTTSILRQIDDP